MAHSNTKTIKYLSFFLKIDLQISCCQIAMHNVNIHKKGFASIIVNSIIVNNGFALVNI